MDTFSIYYYHGGHFHSVEDEVVYVGGEIYSKHGLDADRIGFLDLIDDMENLGYNEVKLSYKAAGMSLTDGRREIVDDR